MLVQKNDDDLEEPISFFSRGLEGYEERFSFVEKHVLAVIRSLKKFKPLIQTNKVHFLVAHPSIKDFFVEQRFE